jgi:hypothetical protein
MPPTLPISASHPHLHALQVQPVLLQVGRDVLAREAVGAHQLEDLLGDGLCGCGCVCVPKWGPLAKRGQRGALQLHSTQSPTDQRYGDPPSQPATTPPLNHRQPRPLTVDAQLVDRRHKLLVHLDAPDDARLFGRGGVVVALRCCWRLVCFGFVNTCTLI